RIEDLQREQIVAQNALTQQTRVLGPGSEAQAVPPSSAYANSSERPEDAIHAERKKRDYLSLFASNVALSYRKGSSSPQTHEENANSLSSTADANAAQLPELLKPFPAPTLPGTA